MIELKKINNKIKNIEHRLKRIENKFMKAQAVGFDKIGEVNARIEELEEIIKELNDRLVL